MAITFTPWASSYNAPPPAPTTDWILEDPHFRLLASGNVALLDEGKVVWIGPLEDAEYAAYCHEEAKDYVPSCSLCDAVGHGYVGGGPCPLEERGAYEPDPWL